MYVLSISRPGSEITFALAGCDAAYEAFRMACELCELTGGRVSLCDAETGEILADNSEDEDLGIPLPEPEDLTEPWWEG